MVPAPPAPPVLTRSGHGRRSIAAASADVDPSVAADGAGDDLADAGDRAKNDPAGDAVAVALRLRRPPQGAFVVVVREADGRPLVIRNDPLLDDGTPMPTRYWLLRSEVHDAVSRLEGAGGVRAAEADVSATDLADAHRRYAAERDAAVPAQWSGPRPSGGVGGTRTGVKCLHAHYAWYLAGGDDPVGRWVAGRLAAGAPVPGVTR